MMILRKLFVNKIWLSLSLFANYAFVVIILRRNNTIAIIFIIFFIKDH